MLFFLKYLSTLWGPMRIFGSYLVLLCAAGLFRTYAEAEHALPAVRKLFPTAFIIAFDGGQPLALSKARQKESSVTVVTEEVRIVK